MLYYGRTVLSNRSCNRQRESSIFNHSNNSDTLLRAFTLGFELLPPDGEVHQLIVDSDSTETPSDDRLIYRLAVHLADVARSANINILRQISTDVTTTDNFYLPGVGRCLNRPTDNATSKMFSRICECPHADILSNAQDDDVPSACKKCGCPIVTGDLHDTNPKKGFLFYWDPTSSPTYSLSSHEEMVCRLCQLLVSLAIAAGLMKCELRPEEVQQLISGYRPEAIDHVSLGGLLSRNIMSNLNSFLDKYLRREVRLTLESKFRIIHLLLNSFLTSTLPSALTAEATCYIRTEARERFEAAISDVLRRNSDLLSELRRVRQLNWSSDEFGQAMDRNSHLWPYQPRVQASRSTVLDCLKRKEADQYPFLNMLVEDENQPKWPAILNANTCLGDALRFVALVRTTLKGRITREEASKMKIKDGLMMIKDVVQHETIALDGGRKVSRLNDIKHLFDALRQLWSHFIAIPDTQGKTFLATSDPQLKAKPTLSKNDSLMFVIAGVDAPQASFITELLNHAINAASSITTQSFLQQKCQSKSERAIISCSNAPLMQRFDECIFPHVACKEVDRFIRDNLIDEDTLDLAESFAKVAILGSSGSPISPDIVLEEIPTFVFKRSPIPT